MDSMYAGIVFDESQKQLCYDKIKSEMTEKEFDIYIVELKKKHRNILVFETERQD